MRSLSVRARITMGSLAVAAVLLAAALFLVRAQVAAILSGADASLAQTDLASFEADIAANPDEAVDDPGTGILVLVRDPTGAVQVNTLPHDVLELVGDAPPSDEEYTTTDDEGRTFVVVGRNIPTPDGSWALWSARSTASSELALEGLDSVLVVGGLVLLAGFGAASWFVASLTLRPVDAARTREKQMVSDAAHELRTPLAVLKTQLELAHRNAGDADALAIDLGSAELSVDRLSSLASNLLELSRLESAKASTRLSPADTLADEFTGAVDRARLLALASSVSVDFEAEITDGAALYRVDPPSFGRLIDNLLSNAVAAVAHDGTVLTHLSQSNTRLILTVTDDGPGMPDAFLPVAFERFTRADSSRAASTGGSGLGLALVRAIAKDAGGEATVENTRPGLRVTVSMPKM